MTDELRRRILDAVTGDLDPDTERRLAEDLATNDELAREYQRLREVWDALGELPSDDPPAGAREKALGRLREEIRTGSGVRPGAVPRSVGVRRWAAGIAAALTLLVVGGLAGIAWGRANPRVAELGAEEPLPTAADPAPNAERPLFAFIIRGEPETNGADLELAMSGFARALWTEDRLIWAERLSTERAAWVSDEGGAPADVPSAARLFMVRAADREEAMRLARQAPHLARGGAVEILGSSPTPGG